MLGTPADVTTLLDAILHVETKSWKHDLGLSIAARDAQRDFYSVMLPAAAEAGLLSAHVLTVSAVPVA